MNTPTKGSFKFPKSLTNPGRQMSMESCTG